eukprot:430099_1
MTRPRYNGTTVYRSRIRFATGSPKISKILMYSMAAAGISLSLSQYDQIYAATHDLKSPSLEIDVPVDMSLTKEGMTASVGAGAAGAGAVGAVGALSWTTVGACVAAGAVIGVVGYLGYYTYCVYYCDNSSARAPQSPPVDYKSRVDKLLKEKYFETHGHPTTTYWNHAKKKDKESIPLSLPQGDHVIVLKPGNNKGEFSVVHADIQAQKYMKIIRSDIMGTQTYENSFSIPPGWIFTRIVKMKLEVQCTEEGNLDIWVFSKQAPPITEMQKIVYKVYLRFAKLFEISVERRQEKE